MKFQGRSPKFKDFSRKNSFSRTFQGKPKIQGLFKDCGNPGNWRPISLLNVDYKIAAHILANRIKTILPKIIHSDQNGFIKGRNINYNIRMIQDIIDYSNNHNLKGLTLFVDFAKAFDTVEWEYMFTVLKQFNSGNSFIHWVHTLYYEH